MLHTCRAGRAPSRPAWSRTSPAAPPASPARQLPRPGTISTRPACRRRSQSAEQSPCVTCQAMMQASALRQRVRHSDLPCARRTSCHARHMKHCRLVWTFVRHEIRIHRNRPEWLRLPVALAPNSQMPLLPAAPPACLPSADPSKRLCRCRPRLSQNRYCCSTLLHSCRRTPLRHVELPPAYAQQQPSGPAVRVL